MKNFSMRNYYFHLERCPQDIQISPFNDPLKMFLYQSNQKLKDLFPPPQTLTDCLFTIKKPKHCQCLDNLQDFELTANTDQKTRNSTRGTKHATDEECLVNDSVKNCL